MWHYFRILLRVDDQEISALQERMASGSLHPMELKKYMAERIVTKFWSEKEAVHARAQFEALFQKRDYEQAESVHVSLTCPAWIVDLLKEVKAVTSSSEAKRLIEAGAVELDGQVIKDFKAQVSWRSGSILRAGKYRIVRLQ
jgi:tyrosyl-tRNA synthetase